MENQVKINKITSEFVKSIGFTNAQKNLIENVMEELSRIEQSVLITLGEEFDNKIFLLPLLWLETESSSIIEGTKTQFEDFSYDLEVIDNMFTWENRNLINLYEKYFSNSKKIDLDTFMWNEAQVSLIHSKLFETNYKSKFSLDFDPKARIKQVTPGMIICNDSDKNWTGGNNAAKAKLVYLKPSEKKIWLNDLMSYIGQRISENSLTIEDIAKFHPIFEAIHPYKDGNGRLGRLLLSIIFAKWKPNMIYSINLSEIFKKRKDEYFVKLFDLQISENNCNPWYEWNIFFVSCVLEAKQKMKKRLLNLMRIWNICSSDSKIKGNEKRLKILTAFFKFYRINREHTIKKLNRRYNYSISTLYTDFDIVIKVINASTIDNKYFTYDQLGIIIRI